jgi:histidinol-phosphate/aromatic aminotransferase/cobyric acid decarboxylase-like protein
MDGTVIQLDDNQSVTRFIPKAQFDWTQSNQYFKTVNIYKLSKDFCHTALLPFLETYIKVKGIQEYYEEVFKLLIHIQLDSFKGLIIDKLWYEIDTQQDLEMASLLFSDAKTKSVLLQKRFGGYWRFPKLKDFCYLVNPYFPPQQMLEEMKFLLPTLISAYPSGLETQNMMASSIFNCEPSQLTVGNGASELIKALLPLISGKIGIPVPTFNEYPSLIAKQQLVEFSSYRKQFQYTVEDLLNFCRKTPELAALILINPDNPSGHFFPKDQLIILLETLEDMGITLILDESFVDFADRHDNHSLIAADLLQQYKHLIVIKSLGKSYGVAGCRLGIVASSDTQIITKVKKNLPIWNINAFAECFLQIFGKYTAHYRTACHQLILDRQLLFKQLNEISFLKPIPSNANFILCELSEKFTPDFLVNQLLDAKWILIKDCSDKRGFEKQPYLRIAVRDTADNNYLVQCLKEMDT